jgi:hypothetical protein
MYLNGFLPVVCAVALPISVTTNHHAAARFWPTLPLLTGSYGSIATLRDTHVSSKRSQLDDFMKLGAIHVVRRWNLHHQKGTPSTSKIDGELLCSLRF